MCFKGHVSIVTVQSTSRSRQSGPNQSGPVETVEYTKWSAWSGPESAHFGVTARSCFSVICVSQGQAHRSLGRITATPSYFEIISIHLTKYFFKSWLLKNLVNLYQIIKHVFTFGPSVSQCHSQRLEIVLRCPLNPDIFCSNMFR